MVNDQPKVYLVRAGKDGEDEANALEHRIAILGWDELPALPTTRDLAVFEDMLKEKLPDANPNAVRNWASQLRAFASTIAEGDFVVMPRKRTPYVAIAKVTGPYEHRDIGDIARHVRPVEWLQEDVPRSAFKQDLLYSFGAYIAVCRIKRNDAERRVAVAAVKRADPGPSGAQESLEDDPNEETAALDLAGAAHDAIMAQIEARFKGHGMAHLVSGILNAEGWVTKVSSPGADGGRDILAGQGLLGLDEPSLCVQVKSQDSRTGVEVYQALVGAMDMVRAKQGLLVCWGGFTKATTEEAKAGHFRIRLWDSTDLVKAIYRTYERLPSSIKAELPLQRVWMFVPDDSGGSGGFVE